MEAKVVSVKDVVKNNPTLCLSPARYFEKCHKCSVFQKMLQCQMKKHEQENLSIKELIEIAVSEMSCKPQIKNEVIELLARKQELLQELAEIRRRIDEL